MLGTLLKLAARRSIEPEQQPAAKLLRQSVMQQQGDTAHAFVAHDAHFLRRVTSRRSTRGNERAQLG
jgi:hypothetical protein